MPQISRAQPPEEAELLKLFDGVTATPGIIATLCQRLGAPLGAVRARVEELWIAGVLVTA